jgi:hypothetical protein
MAGDPTIAAPGSYQQYKSDTAAFLTWLQNAAKSCSWKVSSNIQILIYSLS